MKNFVLLFLLRIAQKFGFINEDDDDDDDQTPYANFQYSNENKKHTPPPPTYDYSYLDNQWSTEFKDKVKH